MGRFPEFQLPRRVGLHHIAWIDVTFFSHPRLEAQAQAPLPIDLRLRQGPRGVVHLTRLLGSALRTFEPPEPLMRGPPRNPSRSARATSWWKPEALHRNPRPRCWFESLMSKVTATFKGLLM